MLSLDATIEEEVGALKRDLLKLIGIGEFNAEAEWRDPAVSFILPEVICKQCNHCRGVDLCKDPYQGTENGVAVWHCSLCKTNYNTDEIEHMLLDIVYRKSMGGVLQDVQCARCKEVKFDNMSSHCECAGVYKTLNPHDEFIKNLHILNAISQHYHMPLLTQHVQWMLHMNKESMTS